MQNTLPNVNVSMTAATEGDDLIVRYAVANANAFPIDVENAYRRVPADVEDAKSWPLWKDTGNPRPRGVAQEEWVPAGTANCYVVGQTLLLLHTTDYAPVPAFFQVPPITLNLSRVEAKSSREYALRLRQPLREWELFGPDTLQPAVAVNRIVLRMLCREGSSSARDIDGAPGIYAGRGNRCISGGVDLARPLLVHPTLWPADRDPRSLHQALTGQPAPTESRAVLTKRGWDEAYGRFD